MIHRDLRDAAILIIDDDAANVELLESFLEEDGYTALTSTHDPRQVLPLYEAIRPDLILLDLHMPHLDGFEVMRQLAARIPAHEFVPLLVLTADITAEARQRALSEGAKDFLSKPLDEVEVLLRIRNLLETRFLYLEQRAAREAAEANERRTAFVAEASRVLGSSFDSQTTLSMLAHLAVPALADVCIIDLHDREGGMTRVGLAHADPETQSLLRGREPPRNTNSADRHPLARLLLEEKPLLLPTVPDELSAAPEDGGWRRGEAHDIWSFLRPHSLVSAPLVTSSGRILGALTMISAESTREYEPDDLALAEELARRATLALENAGLFHDAEQASRARDDVLAIVAHDLRNPLNTIHLATSLLLETVPEAAHRKHLAIVSRSVDRMNRLIQDLLEVTRLESGKLSMELRAEAVAPLLAEAETMLCPLAAASSIQLEPMIPDDLPAAIMDSARILQVISNLVGNAIKFTPQHGVIRLGCEAIEGQVRFSVSDTGRGIPPEQLPHIFNRFWQASRGDRRGLGLGLSIARGIVEAHGGSIWVESVIGTGTTFYFTLPMAPAPAPAPAEVARSVATAEMPA